MTVRWRTTAIAVTAMLTLSLGTGAVAAEGAPGRTWLVQQGGGCGAPTHPTPSDAYGLVAVGQDGTSTVVTVQILRGRPNERYTVNISCVGAIGDVFTNARGRGSARILIERDSPFAIDVHLYCVSGDCTARWGEAARTATLAPGP